MKTLHYITFLAGIIIIFQTTQTSFYRTKKGEKFHLKSCKTVKGKDTLKITLKEAKKKGMQACRVCNPLNKKKHVLIEEKKSTHKTKIDTKKQVATRCTATTQKGTRCKRRTKNSNGRCWQHQ